MSPRAAAPADDEHRRPRVFGALAAALPDRVGGRRPAEERPDLKVVEPTRRRRRHWQVGTFAGLMLFAALFLIAGAQTLIVQQQGHLDDLNDRIDTAAQESERLRIELAELESPERIKAEAESKLGMVDAAQPVYLLPQPDDDAKAAEVPPTTAPRPVTTTAPKATEKATDKAGSSSTPTTAAGATTKAKKKSQTTTPTTTASAGSGSGR